MAEQENHNLCVGGSNPFAAIAIMKLIEEYLAGIEELDKSVDEVARILNHNNQELDSLTEKLGILFGLFTRGDELSSIIRTTSANLAQAINSKKSDFLFRENFLKMSGKRLTELSQLLKSLIDLLHQMRGKAGHFLKSAQALIYLAKNTEIKAYQSRNEGKGLAIIARQALSLACNGQIPLHKFGVLLEGLAGLTTPSLEEMKTVVAMSRSSVELLAKSITSLKTIDETITALRKIITRIEGDKEVFTHLRDNVQAGLEFLKNQLSYSRNAMDDLSIRSTQMRSSAYSLRTLSELLVDSTHNSNIYVANQFRYLLKENKRLVSKLSVGKKPPIFPAELSQNIVDINKQLTKLNDSIQFLGEFKEALGLGLGQIIEYGNQIQEFFQRIEVISKNLDKLSNNLINEFKKVDELTGEITNVLNRLKTLTIFAKIEQGRSQIYRKTIEPVVQEFIQLARGTEDVLAQIKELISRSKDLIQKTKTTVVTTKLPQAVSMPDYSRIKIFIDELLRVFESQLDYIKKISERAKGLDRNNRKLMNSWQEYELAVGLVIDKTDRLDKIPELHYSGVVPITRKEQVVRINLVDDPMTLKPELKTDTNSHKVISNFSTGLFQFGEGVELNLGICEDYEISEDGKEYILKMREGIKYHNGERLRIEHIKRAFLKALSGPNFSFFNMIQGAEQYIQDEGVGLKGIDIIDNRTLRIRLEYPFLPILANLATDIVDPYIDDELPQGIGPFRLVSWEKRRRIILEAFDDYFEGRPSIDELHFLIVNDPKTYELFLEGKLDIYQPSQPMFSKMEPGLRRLRHSIPELSTYYICMNCQKKPFNNKLVRKALAYAIDQEYLVKNFMAESAIPARGIFPPSLRVFNRRLKGYNYDLNQARQLLKKAGYQHGLPDQYPFDIVNAGPVVEWAGYIKESLEKLGIRIELNPLPSDILLEKSFSGRSILALRGWLSDNGDPDNFLYPLFHTQSFGRTGNTSFFSEPNVDKKIEQARRIRNLNERIALYREIEEIILDECPVVFLYHSVQNVLIQKRILGFKAHPLGLIRGKYIVSRTRDDINNFIKHRTSDLVGLKT